MNIVVMGAGRVGLVTGSGLAHWGHDVACVDTDGELVTALRTGRVPFVEPDLPRFVREGLDSRHLRFATHAPEVIPGAEMVFLCVNTAAGEDGGADVSNLLAATGAVGAYFDRPLVLAQKSTAPVGTHRRVEAAVHQELARRHLSIPFQVVCNPEFLREGRAVRDFLAPERVVVGGRDPDAKRRVGALFAHVVPADRILYMDAASAEMAKYAANCFLAARISLINEVANLCEALGADIDRVSAAIGLDSRIGRHYLDPGVGYGGPCLPKDVKALVVAGLKAGHAAEILSTVDQVNNAQRQRLAWRIGRCLGAEGGVGLRGQRVSIWGLAFKPETDDMREAPSLTVVLTLLALGATVRVHDPVAMSNARRMWGRAVEYASDPYDCVVDARAVALLTEWPEYRELDLRRVASLMAGAHLFDGRNALDPEAVAAAGLVYHGVGRGRAEPLSPLDTSNLDSVVLGVDA